MRLTRGATRIVLLAFGLAIKFPRFYVGGKDDGPRRFNRYVARQGVRANLLEREWSRSGHPQLCPMGGEICLQTAESKPAKPALHKL